MTSLAEFDAKMASFGWVKDGDVWRQGTGQDLVIYGPDVQKFMRAAAVALPHKNAA